MTGGYGAHDRSERADADRMLDGPRFRTLCMTLAHDLDPRVTSAVRSIEFAVAEPFARLDSIRPPADVVATLAARLGAVAPEPIQRWTDPLRLFPALGAAVDAAMPWQPPFVADAVTEIREVREALRPVAEAVLRAPAAAWWGTGVDTEAQWVVSPVREDGPVPTHPDGSVRQALACWRRNHLDEEARAIEHTPVESAVSGIWWSTPVNFGVPGSNAFMPSSARRLESLPAVGLSLVEDGFGDVEALVYRLRPRRGLRIFEVHAPEDWVALVARYPIAARWARRGVWWASTGLEADWLVPDYEAVARDWDAVHVSVRGYLATAGRALSVGDANATVLAGWGPDETYWLTDEIAIDPAPEGWTRPGDEMHEWVLSGG